jgi:hypothetical protein
MPKDIAQARARIDNLLMTRRISAEDHQMLLVAMGGQQRHFGKIFSLVINPFEKISIGTAMIIGALIIILLSYAGAQCALYFPGVLDLQLRDAGSGELTTVAPLGQNAVNIPPPSASLTPFG